MILVVQFKSKLTLVLEHHHAEHVRGLQLTYSSFLITDFWFLILREHSSLLEPQIKESGALPCRDLWDFPVVPGQDVTSVFMCQLNSLW